MDLIDFGRYAGALFVTLGLMGAAVLALKRFGPRFRHSGVANPF